MQLPVIYFFQMHAQLDAIASAKIWQMYHACI